VAKFYQVDVNVKFTIYNFFLKNDVSTTNLNCLQIIVLILDKKQQAKKEKYRILH
jgi:hypothetical protein